MIKEWARTRRSTDDPLCSNEAFDAPRFNEKAFPDGSPVAVHTNETGPSASFAFPKCTSSRSGSFFFFVPHYSASASTDPHLACKYPDQMAIHCPDHTAAAALPELVMWLLLKHLLRALLYFFSVMICTPHTKTRHISDTAARSCTRGFLITLLPIFTAGEGFPFTNLKRSCPSSRWVSLLFQ